MAHPILLFGNSRSPNLKGIKRRKTEEKLKPHLEGVEWGLSLLAALSVLSEMLFHRLPSHFYSAFESIGQGFTLHTQVFAAQMGCFPASESMLFISSLDF